MVYNIKQMSRNKNIYEGIFNNFLMKLKKSVVYTFST